MSTNSGSHALILLSLIILALYIVPGSAKADEPTEDVIRELIRSDARIASTETSRMPFPGFCEQQENKKSAQLPPQGSTDVPAIEKPAARRSPLAMFSFLCKLSELLARGDFEVRKVGCLKSQISLGYNCDFIIQPKSSEGEEAAIFGQFFNPNSVHTSRFVPFDSKWYLASETSPFVRFGFIRGAFSPR